MKTRKKLLKNLQKQAKKMQMTQKTINLFLNQCYKNYKKMKEKMKKIWLILLCAVCLVCATSCNVTRVVTNESQYFQKGDTAITIQTKTIETYNATKNK